MVTPQPYAHDVAPGSWRPFGDAEDLDVDFATDNRAALITSILASCGEPRDAQHWWSQTLGSRIAAMLRLLAVTDAIDHLKLVAYCRQPSCAEPFEFELPLAILNDAVPDNGTVRVALDGVRSVSLRRPNGHDLNAWRSQRLESPEVAIAAMLKSLVVEGQATLEDASVLAEALSAEDPLVAFTLSCNCPACGSPNEVSVDLEDVALSRLKQRQRMLLHEIHGLASHYGWTEAEVLAVAPSRRAQYLAMIEDQR